MGKVLASYFIKVVVRETDGAAEGESTAPPTIQWIETITREALDNDNPKGLVTFRVTAERTDI